METEITRIRNKLKQADDAIKELRNNYNLIKSEVSDINKQAQAGYSEQAQTIDIKKQANVSTKQLTEMTILA